MSLIKKRTTRAIACIALYAYFNAKKQQRTKMIWVKKWCEDRDRHGHMPLLRELRENESENFKNYLRMDNSTFEYILNLIRPYIQKQDTVMRECITAEERLAATLRFLTIARSLQDLKFSTSISAPALCHIIPETCWAIFSELKKKFLKVSTNFL